MPGIIIDGSNVAYWGERPSLYPVLALVEALKGKGFDCLCFFDASLPHRIDKTEQPHYRSLIKTRQREFVQAPSRSQADDFILLNAHGSKDPIISNDGFTQYSEKYPWLAKAVEDGRLIRGMCIRNVVQVPVLAISVPVANFALERQLPTPDVNQKSNDKEKRNNRTLGDSPIQQGQQKSFTDFKGQAGSRKDRQNFRASFPVGKVSPRSTNDDALRREVATFRKMTANERPVGSARHSYVGPYDLEKRPTDCVIELDGATMKGERGTAAIGPLNLRLSRGETYFLYSTSSIEQDTFFQLLCLDKKPQSGCVKFLGYNMTAAPRNEVDRARYRIGVVSPTAPLDNRKSIFENIASPLRDAEFRPSDIEGPVREMAVYMELEDWLDEPANSLDPDERLRIEFARAIIKRPDLLILRGPWAWNNQSTELLLHVAEAMRKLGTAVLFTGFDLVILSRLPQSKLLRMSHGQLHVPSRSM